MQSNWLGGLHIQTYLVSAELLWFCNLLFVLVLGYAVYHAGWRELGKNSSQQHVYFGAIAMLLLMWGFKAGITPGLGFHHLGATLFALMFGWARAIMGLGVVLVASYVVGQPDWLSLGINGLLSVVLPILVSFAILRLSWRFLPDNMFIYIFVCAFFGAAIAVAASRFAVALVLLFSGAYPWDTLWNESIIILPLFMLPEGFITGLLITLFVVYLPNWVRTFDDARYLHGK